MPTVNDTLNFVEPDEFFGIFGKLDLRRPTPRALVRFVSWINTVLRNGVKMVRVPAVPYVQYVYIITLQAQ